MSAWRRWYEGRTLQRPRTTLPCFWRTRTIALAWKKHLENRKAHYENLLNADTTHYKKKILQQCNLNDYITPNLVYDEEKSEAAQKDLLSNISWANGFVLNGQKIIDRGEIVDEQTYNILESLRKEWEKRSDSVQEKRLTLAGQILYVGIFLFCFMAYLELFRADYQVDRG